VAATEETLPIPRLRARGSVVFDLTPRSSVNLTAFLQRERDRDGSLYSIGYAMTPPGGWRLGATALYDRERRSWAGQVFLRVPLGPAAGASAAVEAAQGGRTLTQLRADRSPDPDGGLGYAAEVQPERRLVRGDVVWYGPAAVLGASLAATDGKAAVRVTAAGSVVAIGGRVMAARHDDGAVALVDIGEPGIHVLKENRVVAVTGRDGRALVSGLTPGVRTTVSVDPSELPFDLDVAATQLGLTPLPRSGVRLDFKARPVDSLILVVRFADGAFPSPGSILTLENAEPAIVGRGGQAYIRGAGAVVRGSITRSGRTCRVVVAPPPATEAIRLVEGLCVEASR
jgi:outer membrane usher protein